MWRSVPLLPWQMQCPVRVCAALAAGSGGSGRHLVLCLSRFPLPAPRVPRCVWRAVLSGCPLPSLAGTPFHAVCAFRVLGPVALLVVTTCPLRVCAHALSRRPLPPPLGGVACAPRAVPALGAGRAVPRGPCPSACPAPVPCFVWRAWGGAVRSRLLPTWLGAVRTPWGGSVAFVCRGAGLGGGAARAPCPPFVRQGGPVGRGVALPRSVPLPPLGRQQSGCHWRRSGHGGRGPHTTPVRARPPSLGAICAATWRVGAGLHVPRGSCGSRQLVGGGGGTCSGSSLRRGEGGRSPLPRRVGAGALAACGPLGGWGGGLRCGLPAPPLGGSPRFPTLAPLLLSAHSPPACVFGRGRGAAPGGGATRSAPWTAPPGAPSDLNPPSALPEWEMVMGGVMGGAAPILFWCAAVRRPQAWSACRCSALVWACSSAATPAGAGSSGRLGARFACPAASPPPPASRSLLGERACPLGSGGAEGRSCGPQAGGGGGRVGGGGGAAPPPPTPPPRRASACHPLSPAGPPGVHSCRGGSDRARASGAARLPPMGQCGGGGREGGGGGPPWSAPPPSPGRPLKGLLRLRRPGRRQSAVSRQRAGRERAGGSTGALAAAAVPPHPGCRGLFGGGAGPPPLRSASVRSWA